MCCFGAYAVPHWPPRYGVNRRAHCARWHRTSVFLRCHLRSGTRAYGRFIDAESPEDDQPIRAMVRPAVPLKLCSCLEAALDAKPVYICD